MSNKYHARKVTLFGQTFDSKGEGARYLFLRAEVEAGRIRNLRVHSKFTLQEAFQDSFGRSWRAITYTADFAYYTVAGLCVVEDFKGGRATQTQAFRIKAKLFMKENPEIKFKIVTNPTKAVG